MAASKEGLRAVASDENGTHVRTIELMVLIHVKAL